jgi:hypothetical protein
MRLPAYPVDTQNSQSAFLMRKRVIFRKVKERGDFPRRPLLEYAAQGKPSLDAEIAEQGRFRTGTSLGLPLPIDRSGHLRPD